MLAKRNTQPLSLFDSFFPDFPRLTSWGKQPMEYRYNKDYDRTYSVAGYSKEDLVATANPKTNKLTIKSEDNKVYYAMELPSNKYDVTQAELEVNNGLLYIHIPLMNEDEDSIQLPIK